MQLQLTQLGLKVSLLSSQNTRPQEISKCKYLLPYM